jgi:hypothetical protein
MIQRLVVNNDGEPMYVENVRDIYEEEEAWCEEMDRRAEDPFYAAKIEDRKWYNEACAIFEERGISVPEDVIESLKKELRKREEERQKETMLNEAKPTIDYLNEKIPNCGFVARFIPEGYDEVAHVETTCEIRRPYAWELAEAIDSLTDEDWEKGISVEDYFSSEDCETMVGYCAEGGGWVRFARNWTAEEYCGQEFVFALRNNWIEDERLSRKEKYIKAIWAVAANNEYTYERFKKAYPKDKYTIWTGEIRHNGKYNDTICFHWS